MKLISSLLLLSLNLNVQAALVEVSHLPGQNEIAKVLERLLNEQFYVPQALIKLRESKHPCKPRKETIVHLCIDSKEDFKMAWLDKKRFDFTLAHMIELPPIDLASEDDK